MGGNIRWTICVNTDNGICLITMLQSNPTILGDGVQIRHIHIKVFSSNRNDGWVNFKTVDGNIPEDNRCLSGNRPSCKSDDRHASNLPNLIRSRIKEGCYKELLPWSSIVQIYCVPNRMNA